MIWDEVCIWYHSVWGYCLSPLKSFCSGKSWLIVTCLYTHTMELILNVAVKKTFFIQKATRLHFTLGFYWYQCREKHTLRHSVHMWTLWVLYFGRYHLCIMNVLVSILVVVIVCIQRCLWYNKVINISRETFSLMCFNSKLLWWQRFYELTSP